MEKAIQKSEEKTITEAYTNEQLDLIKSTIARGANNEQLKLFLYQAQRAGLDPLAKQIHCVLRRNSKTGKMDMSIQTAIDGFRLIADRTGKYAGNDDAEFIEKENSKFPVSAKSMVYKMVDGVRCPFSATARWDEYYPGDGPAGFMWRKMSHVMLAKCAEALALRKAFPAELSGIYTNDEMDQAGVVEAPTTVKMVPEKTEPKKEAETPPAVEAEVDEDDIPVDPKGPSPDPEQRLFCKECGCDVKEGETVCQTCKAEKPAEPEKPKAKEAKEKHVSPGSGRELTHEIEVKGKRFYTAGMNSEQANKILDYAKSGPECAIHVETFLKNKSISIVRELSHSEAEILCGIISTNQTRELGRQDYIREIPLLLKKKGIENRADEKVCKQMFCEAYGAKTFISLKNEDLKKIYNWLVKKETTGEAVRESVQGFIDRKGETK